MEKNQFSLRDEYRKNCVALRKKNLIHLRSDIAQMSMDDFAKELGLQKPNISAIENGKRDLSMGNITAYRTYFQEKHGINVSVDYLLGYTDAITNEPMNIADDLGLSGESVKLLKTATDEEKAVLNALTETGALRKLSSLTRDYYRHLGEPMKLGDDEVGIENKRGYFDMILSQKMLFLFKDFIENNREIYNLFTRNVLIDKIEELREKAHSVGHPKEVISATDRSCDEAIEEIRTHDYYADYIESQKGSD